MPPYVGRAMSRIEDRRLVTGQGRYAGDIRLEGLAHAAFLRSPLAHADVRIEDLETARSMPGVLAVLTRDDLPESARAVSNWVPADQPDLARPVLASDHVNYSGEAVVAVVAESAYQAQDAIAALGVDFQPLPAATGARAAGESTAHAVHAGHGNLGRHADYGYGDAEAAFRDAPILVRHTFHATRVCAAAMEPRVATATWDGDGGKLTIWSSTQGVFSVRDTVATALDLDRESVVVLAHDVGGGFGPKGTVYGEEIFVAAAARMLGRPVTWTATRSEDTATTVHAHGTEFEMELAAEADGRLRGLRGRLFHDLGAYPGPGNGQCDIIVPHMMSAYRLPAMAIAADMVYTNTAPTGFIRGGGRPLGNYVIERLMDLLALEAGLDPVEVRRRNLVPAAEMPYDTGFPQGRRTVVYDGGDYPRLLEEAAAAIGYDELRARGGRTEDGRLLGVAVTCCVESSGFGSGEPARVRIEPDGTAHLFIGSTPHGQGHDTAAAQVLADRLGWPFERIRVTSADTRGTDWALFTAGSRTAMHMGNAVSVTARAARDRILEAAAEKLEADPVDLVLEEGVVSVRGVPGRRLDVREVFPEGLEVAETWQTRTGTAYSSGAHAVAVAVDPETGGVELLRYVIVHDTGNPINPLLVSGQMHGGLAHGLGYAMFEEAVYQPDGGFTSASFLDYTIVSAPEMRLDLQLIPVVTPTDANPEGFKGAGESGTVPVPGAVSNAIEDAIRRARPGATVDRLPVTPQLILGLLTGI